MFIHVQPLLTDYFSRYLKSRTSSVRLGLSLALTGGRERGGLGLRNAIWVEHLGNCYRVSQ